MTLSREYLEAGGDSMTREQAVRHFANRKLKLMGEILSLPTTERLRLAADLEEAGAHTMAVSVAEQAARELRAAAPVTEPEP